MTLPRGLPFALLPGLIIGMTLTGKEPKARNEIRVDFDAHPEGAYEMRIFRKDWSNAFLGKFHQRAAIVAESTGNSLRVNYPQGSLGPNEGGGQFRERLAPRKAYRL